ncbi:MAG: nickel-dependent lactate racemase [Desulfobacterales bacterium]
MLNISVPYGRDFLKARLPVERLQFTGQMERLPALPDFEQGLRGALEQPIGCAPLHELVAAKSKVLILVEDNTRNTPVDKILPVLLCWLQQAGVGEAAIEILTAPGTHRVMTEVELEAKLGAGIRNRFRVSQHDFRKIESLKDLEPVRVGRSVIPLQVNRKALEADFVIGIGDIVPHCDAGFSGGAKILQPGICGYATTAATHVAAALLEEIPLGVVDNPCRIGMEEVARRVGLRFIINVVKNFQNEVIAVVAGDFIAAHRRGVEISRRSFGVPVPAPADVVIVSSYPCDIDYWQAEKGIISAYFAVCQGGVIIFAAPCPEGLETNHPRLRDWLRLSYADACAKAMASSPEDPQADLVAADLAILNSRIREKAQIFLVSDGLTTEDSRILGYSKFGSLQEAVDAAFRQRPGASVGVLPRGGDCLPILPPGSPRP